MSHNAIRNNDCFSIIDYATTQDSLSIEEGMHIGWQKPVLTKHLDFWHVLFVCREIW